MSIAVTCEEEALLARLLGAKSESERQRVWAELVKRYSGLIASCVRRALRRWRARVSEDDVDDLIGEVWIALLHDDLRRLRAFEPSRGARLSTFLGLVATNLTIDKLRRLRVDTMSLDDLSTSDRALAVRESITTDLEDRQHAVLAKRALDRLSKDERRFCAQVFSEERDPAELAKELGITKTTVYTRKVKVRDKLRRYVGQMAA